MGKRKRGGNPNYYARRDARARREAAARSPQAIAERLLKQIDVDRLARSLADGLERVAERADPPRQDEEWEGKATVDLWLSGDPDPREGQSGA